MIDPWPYALKKIALAARGLRLDPCFVSFRESAEQLRREYPTVRVMHLPFGADTDVFKLRPVEKDIFAYWMGRRHEPLHDALAQYCSKRGLKYLTTQNGSVGSPDELGNLIARSRYFVVTTPDVDHPERAGGFSPLVMRYLEGIAAGSRLLGTRPRSGELEELGLGDSLLEVQANGSDLETKLDADYDRVDDLDSTYELSELVRVHHSWRARAATVVEALA